MASQLESHKPNTDILTLCMVPFLWKAVTDLLIESFLQALYCETAIVQAVLHTIPKATDEESEPQLRKPDATIKVETWKKVEVKNATPERVIAQASRKKDPQDEKALKKSQKEARKRHRRQSRRDSEAERQRQREWEELWQRKIKVQEDLDDTRCCLGEGLCMKPRTQSSIWINVTEDRNSQEIQMTFKHTPVPYPKPPPLPRLKSKSSDDIRRLSRRIKHKLDKSPSKHPEGKGGKGKHERKGSKGRDKSKSRKKLPK